MSRKGILFVLSAPSGSGKTSLSQALCADMDDVIRSVSRTTRTPRAQEQDGLDYYFINRRQFAESVTAGDFLEWACVHRHRYGTPRQPIDEATAAGKDVLLVIDVQGAAQLRANGVDAVHVFILPPSWQALEERLAGREPGVEPARPGLASERLAVARQETVQYAAYDYVLINDCFAEALAALKAIVLAERHRIRHADPASILQLLNGGA
jgi:guanylate kinase